MFKNKKVTYSLTLIPLLIILGLFIWLFTVIFEGEKPSASLNPLPDFLSKEQQFKVVVHDAKRGLRSLKIFCSQGGRDILISEKKFPFAGFLNRDGIRNFDQEITIDPTSLHLAQGRVDLNVQVWDYSRRAGGDGNVTLLQHKMTVDTIPPAIMTISQMHNINTGGAGLVIYRASSDTVESGIFVNDYFFPGFPANEDSKGNIFLAYFAIPYDSGPDSSVYLYAKDRAENTVNSTFYYHIRRKRFGKERINLTDRFLQRILPYFSFYQFDPEDTDVEKYIKINRDLRAEDNENLLRLSKETSPMKFWEGPWLRLKNAATMARYADRRTYYYKDKKIDEQVHLGIDLASLANSPVEAGNNGKVLFAERNGIYGLTVVIDHGQGIASLYGHLSSIEVVKGQSVKKGDIIGHTGQTGLAGGDHLHFSMLVHGVFVNPIEWWDPHWIEDNITKKLELLKAQEIK